MVGATAPVLQDVHATPTSGSGLMAGPEVEANAIWTVLHGVPLREAPAIADLLLILLLGIVAPLARLRFGVLAAAALAAASGALVLAAAQIAFNAGWVLTVVPPLVALVTGIAAMVVVSQLRERIERLRVAHDNELLERLVRERTEELRETQLEVIHRLAPGRRVSRRDHRPPHHAHRPPLRAPGRSRRGWVRRRPRCCATPAPCTTWARSRFPTASC